MRWSHRYFRELKSPLCHCLFSSFVCTNQSYYRASKSPISCVTSQHLCVYLRYSHQSISKPFRLLFPQMLAAPSCKWVLLSAWICVVIALVLGTPAIKEIRPKSNRPGRFLSLPVPSKCSSRKYSSMTKPQPVGALKSNIVVSRSRDRWTFHTVASRRLLLEVSERKNRSGQL